ncbi:hypothetical protein [Sediminibacterium sp. TEGAF015]|uniref:hypothetical protein n=1 Tax=Sediminibacterium sp. TEGAF015 TaxID=575378 RepID=UPI00220B6D5D|nr:hypothetical protein [Sediminibacterium sp. TEGAF015]BDQ12490.1 hypothetical protein TEGAF0_17070 [Sediminibacterium sp. TEGAF015]
MLEIKLDRNSFKAQSADAASNHTEYYKNLDWRKRLEITNYLNSIAYQYPLNSPPKMDKLKFSARSIQRNG